MRYRGRLSQFTFGQVSAAQLAGLLTNGRLSGVLLEYELAAAFGVDHGGQGAGADLLDGGRPIQVKTFHRKDPTERFRSGPDRGKLKVERADIWTTKSGLFDRQMTVARAREADAYIGRYNAFLYLDISRLDELVYEFVLLPSATVARLKVGPCIAQAAIYRQVVGELDVPSPS